MRSPRTFPPSQLAAIVLSACAGLAACGGDKPAADAADTTGAGTDTGVPDTKPVGDAAIGGGADGAGPACGANPGCLNPKGQEDLSLCPVPQTEYQCKAGCCVKKAVCKTDADCAGKLGTDTCADPRFTCGCSLDSGECTQSMCVADAGCPKGTTCSQGGCIVPLAAGDLQARLLRPTWLGLPGGVIEPVVDLGAQALDGKGNVKLDAEFEWTLGSGDAFKLDGAKITATDKPGKVTVTAKVKGSAKPASNPATLWNFGALPAGKLRVTAVDDATLQPLLGKVVLVDLADQTTPAAAVVADLKEGHALFDAPKGKMIDIHVIGANHEPVSVLRHDPAVAELVVPAPPHLFVDIEMDADGKLIADKSKVANADLRVGEVEYSGIGEAGLGLTSLAFGPALLNFSLDAIIGPGVKRPFHKDAPKLLNPTPGKSQDIPGGVTFHFAAPVVTSYVLAGSPGVHVLWSLAGRIEMSKISSETGKLVSAFDSGGNIGSVVSVLLPFLQTFSSYVEFGVPFGDKPASPLTKHPKITPSFPLGHRLAVQMADLPKTAAGWADLVFVIGGALLPSGQIVPLGLTAGSDSADSDDKADGKVDGSSLTKGIDPLELAVGPLHSGLRVGAANHLLVHAAVILGGKGKKEGASIQIEVPGLLPATAKVGPFLAFPLGSTWDAATRTLTMAAVEGAQFYRTTFVGAEGHQWVVIVPGAQAGKAIVVPDIGKLGGPSADVSTEPKRVFVGAFELRKPLAWKDLLGPGGLPDLVRQVKRTAFLDAMP
ncbi:MAG: hypothetical protein EXR79_00650 [Myxococcales bacterium]|nr:hypothetical protein [Myxococcales bacterium]